MHELADRQLLCIKADKMKMGFSLYLTPEEYFRFQGEIFKRKWKHCI